VKILLSFVQVLTIGSSLMGQPVEWRGGMVVLTDDQVLTGTIYYPQRFGMIFLRTDKDKVALSAAKVHHFRYYDSAANINRKFVSIKINKWESRFYELVIGGEVNVLRELKRYADKSHPDEIDSYWYYTLINNTMVPLMHFRNKVYPKLLEEQLVEIQTFVHRERLDLNEMRSALLIIKEFNRIKENTLQARIN
jgi:hypothetical protein